MFANMLTKNDALQKISKLVYEFLGIEILKIRSQNTDELNK